MPSTIFLVLNNVVYNYYYCKCIDLTPLKLYAFIGLIINC